MPQSLITILVTLGGIASYSLVHASTCNTQETKPCTCSTEDGPGISLIELMDKRAGDALSVKTDQYTYYIEPCNTPVTNPVCSSLDPNLVACQVASGTTAYGLGKLNGYTVGGDPEKGTVTFTNQYESSGTTRIMKLLLACSTEEANLAFVNQTSGIPPITYTLRLDTVYACLNKPDSSSGGLSAGSVLVILFFVAVIVYLVGGTLFLRYVRKAEGRETIPNYEFWTDFPSLVKDGVLFTCRGCKAESTYEKI